MSTKDEKNTERRHAFLIEAESCGIDREIANAAYEVFCPWLRKETLSLKSTLYGDFGIVNEDLEDVVFSLWKKALGRSITKNEAGAFPHLVTVGDVVFHVAKHARCDRSSTPNHKEADSSL